PDMDGVLQSPSAAQGPWRSTAGSVLFTDSRSNATRSAGADQSLKSVTSCPRDGEHLTMQEKPTERIRGVFGWNGFPDALFYEANYALRFDLCGELPSHPLRFLRAMDRAREVASAIFEQSLNLTAIVCYYDGERRSSRPASSFKTLADIGFQAEFRKPERIPLN